MIGRWSKEMALPAREFAESSIFAPVGLQPFLRQ